MIVEGDVPSENLAPFYLWPRECRHVVEAGAIIKATGNNYYTELIVTECFQNPTLISRSP